MDWVEVPKYHPVFVDSDGHIRQICCTYGIMHTDAVGQPQSQNENPQGHSRGDRSDDWDPLPKDVSNPKPHYRRPAAHVQVTEPCGLFTLSDSALPRHERWRGGWTMRTNFGTSRPLTEADQLYCIVNSDLFYTPPEAL